MKRLIEKIVFCGLVTACRLATVPTSRSPEGANATTEGVVRPPSAFSITVGSPPSSTAMHELVVPRSMPMVLAMCACSLDKACAKSESHYGRFCAPLDPVPGPARDPNPAARPARAPCEQDVHPRNLGRRRGVVPGT